MPCVSIGKNVSWCNNLLDDCWICEPAPRGRFFFFHLFFTTCTGAGEAGSLKRQLLLIFFAVLVGLVTFVVSQAVFQNAAITTDEHAYLMQAAAFSEGKIARPEPPASAFFLHEMMIMDSKVGWLSRYPPGHALWLVPGVILGQPRIMVSFAAALAVYVCANIGLLLGLPAFLLPLMLLCSPFFIFMNGTLLSHTSGLPAAALMLFCYVYWKEKNRPLFALFAGLAWSVLFLNRTYTGLLIALPFALDALWDLFKARNRATLSATFLFVISSSLGVLGYLYYNYLAVGDPLLPTYLYYAPSENLGFGMRHLDVLPFEHTFSLGVSYIRDNVLLLDKWLWGFPGSLVVVFFCTVFGWHKRWSLLCVLVCLSVPVGYVFFWFKGITTVGPVYYFELLPFLLLATGLGLGKLLRLPKNGVSLPVVPVVLVVFAGLGLRFMYQQGCSLRAYQAIIGQYQRILKTAPRHSLILVERFAGMHSVEKGTSFNSRGLDSDPLMVAAGKQHPRLILDLFPSRQHFHLFRRGDRLLLEPYENHQPIEYTYFVTGTGATTGINEQRSGEKVRRARNGIDKAGWLVEGDKRLLGPGTYTLQVPIMLDNIDPAYPLYLQVISQDGSILAAIKIMENGDRRPVTMQFSVKKITTIWPRLYYSGTGDVVVRDMKIAEIARK